MTSSNTDFKVFIKNAIKYLSYGFKMYQNGVCEMIGDCTAEATDVIVNLLC